jgi:hypothetical protein
MKLRGMMLLAVVGLLGAACAGLNGAQAVEGTPGVKTFNVSQQDTGKTVTMHIGELLVFTPAQDGPTPPYPKTAWGLHEFPKDQLAWASNPKDGPPFRFVARHSGIGTLSFTFGSPCSAGPVGVKCPVAAGGAMPVRLFSYAVRVYAQG